MGSVRDIVQDKNAVAWLVLMGALGLHLLDETLTDFLPFYNHVVLTLRERWGFFPMPTFSFPLWLGGLLALILGGITFVVVVARGGKFARVVVLLVSVLMAGNALNHMLGSIYLGRLMPGFWSSPLLLPAALLALYRAVRGNWGGAVVAGSR